VVAWPLSVGAMHGAFWVMYGMLPLLSHGNKWRKQRTSNVQT